MSARTSPPSPPPRYPRRPSGRLRVGYVPLIDSAPLLVAQAEGLFRKHDLEVRLSSEPGWASIREKLIYGELDAAECLAGLAFALNFGIGCIQQPVSIPLILSSNGNAITLSNEVPPSILREDHGLKSYLSKRKDSANPFTMATVHPFSSHNALLHTWLNRQGLVPGEEVKIIHLPPPVLSRNLKARTIDGFCVGEPWNSKSILEKQGWCAATSIDLDNGHPEKVLAVSAHLAETRREEVIALTRALLEACRLCRDPAYRPTLLNILSGMNHFDIPSRALGNSLSGHFETGHSATLKSLEFHLFHGDEINAPTPRKANWIISSLRKTGQIASKERLAGFAGVFRPDLYQAALSPAVATA